MKLEKKPIEYQIVNAEEFQLLEQEIKHTCKKIVVLSGGSIVLGTMMLSATILQVMSPEVSIGGVILLGVGLSRIRNEVYKVKPAIQRLECLKKQVIFSTQSSFLNRDKKKTDVHKKTFFRK